jgi:curved DNA-binding protein CbpA
MTHYDTLQVSRTASAEVIESAWKALMRAHHPDVTGLGADHAHALNEAHDILSDPAKRKVYDQSLRPRPAQPLPVDESAYPSAYPDVRTPKFDVSELYAEVVNAVDLPKVIERGLEEAGKAVLGRIIRENPIIGHILDAAQAKAKGKKA